MRGGVMRAFEAHSRGPQPAASCVGSSNVAGWNVALAQPVATARHFLGLTSEQGLPAPRHLGIEVMERLDRIWPGPEEARQAYAW
ncbi:hypothetical protein MQE23_04435 [Streptomyces sp. HP-A2021]|uniref:hypothetical protein n=1 Tax=Streptomyces sp. HP-A2021 TaxID=2927875 RepID=UPI001FAF5D5F|nr:hypothetical protein [Streptomyces sp. HP-A2021]UOB08350.1 hypothetical protein MQE23_04435 [Streptomyces sp. HP-A2021]